MPSFKILMKDGSIKDYPHEGRAGGSYTKTIKYEPGFVVITTEWGDRYAIPTEDIKEIQETNVRW